VYALERELDACAQWCPGELQKRLRRAKEQRLQVRRRQWIAGRREGLCGSPERQSQWEAARSEGEAALGGRAGDAAGGEAGANAGAEVGWREILEKAEEEAAAAEKAAAAVEAVAKYTPPHRNSRQFGCPSPLRAPAPAPALAREAPGLGPASAAVPATAWRGTGAGSGGRSRGGGSSGGRGGRGGGSAGDAYAGRDGAAGISLALLVDDAVLRPPLAHASAVHLGLHRSPVSRGGSSSTGVGSPTPQQGEREREQARQIGPTAPEGPKASRCRGGGCGCRGAFESACRGSGGEAAASPAFSAGHALKSKSKSKSAVVASSGGGSAGQRARTPRLERGHGYLESGAGTGRNLSRHNYEGYASSADMLRLVLNPGGKAHPWEV
jgi:hypothetical protein